MSHRNQGEGVQEANTPYLTRSEVCNLLGIKSHALTYWLRKCKVSQHRIDRRLVIHRDAVRTLVTHYEERRVRIDCQHTHVIYEELIPTETTWTFTDGEITGEPINNAGTVKVVRVFCEDCKFRRTYQLSKAPKWIQTLRQTVLERSFTFEP